MIAVIVTVRELPEKSLHECVGFIRKLCDM